MLQGNVSLPVVKVLLTCAATKLTWLREAPPLVATRIVRRELPRL
jgi:hypothetical protein